LDFGDTDTAGSKAQGFRGFVARRKIKDDYEVNRIGTTLFISYKGDGSSASNVRDDS